MGVVYRYGLSSTLDCVYIYIYMYIYIYIYNCIYFFNYNSTRYSPGEMVAGKVVEGGEC